MIIIRPILYTDNQAIAAVIRSVLIEHNVPKVGTAYADASLRFTPKSVADTLEHSFKRFVTDLKFVSNAPTTNVGKYKIIIICFVIQF